MRKIHERFGGRGIFVANFTTGLSPDCERSPPEK
jgi:hypothetical protein